ncbi:MAG: nicotinamide mononucleotide transporter [Clostridia bacterium]|nr:nicotinamide mononucleotide transporter [Clostridia bacterium]
MKNQTKEKKTDLRKKDIPMYVFMVVTAILITVTGVIYKQSFLRMLPLYISLSVGLFQSRVNRFSTLIGGCNSVLYAIVYFYYHLYGSALYALLVSCPIQILTFVRWNKNKWEQSTVLRRMTVKQRLAVTAGFGIALVVLWFVLPLLGSEYVFLDSASSLLGILTSFLTMFAFVEYTVFMLAGCVVSIVLHVTMLHSSPDIMPHLVYSVYSLVCVFLSCLRARKLYADQQNRIGA